MSARPRVALFLTIALAATLAIGYAAAPAHSISKSKAKQVALKAFGVKKEKKRNVIVFGLPKPLGAKQAVSEASVNRLGIDKPTKKQKAKLKKLGRAAWLFWEDQVPFGHFEHPSRFVLVDDKTGRIVRSEWTMWYPLIDGRRPAFLRSPEKYRESKWQVFKRFKPPEELPQPPVA